MEDLALDRSPLEHGALRRSSWSRRAASSACRLGGTVDLAARVSRAIATISVMNSGLPPAARAIRSRSSAANRLGDQLVDGVLVERLEPERNRPCGPALDSSGRAMHRSRIGALRREQGDGSTRSRNVSSPHWMSSKTHTSGCLLLEQLAEGPGDLLGARSLFRLAQERAKRGRCGRIGRQRVQLLQHLDHRPVGDPLAVGQAAAADDRRLDRGEELGRQPRLADTGIPDHGHELAPSLLEGALPGCLQALQLARPADEGHLVPALRRFVDRDEPMCRNRLCLPLQLERLDRLGLDRVADERERVLADQDLARLRGLLEPRGDVDRVAGRQPLLGSGHDLAGVEADPRLHAELGQGVAHLHCGAAGSERVVLVHLGDAEDSHDRIADELLHRPPVRLDDPLHPLEVAGEQSSQRLGVGRLAQRGRAGDVAEQDGDGLALLAGGGGALHGRSALLAEPRLLAVLMTTAGADRHAARLDRRCLEDNPEPEASELLLSLTECSRYAVAGRPERSLGRQMCDADAYVTRSGPNQLVVPSRLSALIR